MKIRKTLSIVLSFCILFSVFHAFGVAAEIVSSGKCGENLTWTLDDAGTLTITGTGDMTNYEWGLSYGSVSMNTPFRYKDIKNVIIEEGVTSVGKQAFYCCSIESITMPNSITIIGKEAFYGCSFLKNIIYSKNLYCIGEKAFYNCENLVNISLPDNVKAIEENAFYNSGAYNDENNWDNNALYIGKYLVQGKSRFVEYGEYIIKDGTVCIADKAFYCCTKLESLTLPKSMESIGSMALYGCKNLTNLQFEGVITYLGDTPFENSGLLKEELRENGAIYIANCLINVVGTFEKYEIKQGTSVVSKETFINNEDLKVVVIPDSVKLIGEKAFYNCTSLEEIIIENGLPQCEEYAFANCISLKSIKIKNDVKSISPYQFLNCYSLSDVDFSECTNLIGIYFQAFANTNIYDVVIPESVHYIGKEAFCHTRLDYITFLSSDVVFDVGGSIVDNGAFVASPHVTIIGYPDSSVEAYAKQEDIPFRDINGEVDRPEVYDGFVYTVLSNNTLKIRYVGAETHLVIPETINGYKVTKIDQFGFDYNKAIKTVTIPKTITNIGDWAFRGCYNLAQVSLSEGLNRIGSVAFASCKSLKNIEIPKSTTYIGDHAFSNCPLLEEINTKANNPNYCSKDGVLFNKQMTKLIRFPENHDKTEYTLPNTVGTIYKAAFADNKNIKKIIVSEGTSEIDYEAFYGCNKLTEVILPDGVEKIEGYAFAKCTSLASINIPNNLTSISHSTFNDCTSLTEIFIPTGVQNIDNSAFRDCTSLTSITIPNSVTNIDNYVFESCNSLTDVYYLGTKDQWENISISDYNEDLTDANIIFCTLEDKVDVTCTTDGYTGDIVDTDTGEIVKTGEIILSQGHRIKLVGVKQASCFRNGYTGDELCTVCGETVSTGEVVPATEHTYVYEESKEATCTTDGYIGEVWCSACKNIITPRQEIKAHETGDEEWVIIKQPTCIEEGVLQKQCSVCNKSVEKTIPIGSHTQKIINKESTYFSTGYKNRIVCTVCNDVLYKGVTVKKLVLKTPTVKLTANKNKIAVKYKKVKNAKGFQVRYKLTTSKKWRYKTFKTTKSCTKYIKSLKKNKKYHIQARAYIQSVNKKAYSSWTKRKTVKVK